MKRTRQRKAKADSHLGEVFGLNVQIIKLREGVAPLSIPIGTMKVGDHCQLDMAVVQSGGFYLVVKSPDGERVLGRYELKYTSVVVALAKHLFGVEIPERLE